VKKIIFKNRNVFIKLYIMSNKRTKRIVNEIKELQDSSSILEQSGIYFHFDESNISIVYAMLVGPENTPYEKGFYFFKFEYPASYPMQPPITKYCTQGVLMNPVSKSGYNVRFNPNLYTCGKVCLSMLNTWSGPGWVPTNTISNVLVAIQALVLNDFPLTNEPGFENASKKELIKYNEIISYANIKISVLQMLYKPHPEFLFFQDKICEIFMKNIDYYRNFILTKNDTMKDVLIESPAYGMKLVLDYSSLYEELATAEEFVLNNNFSKKVDINLEGK
jgi:ubiquitin-protein ligase